MAVRYLPDNHERVASRLILIAMISAAQLLSACRPEIISGNPEFQNAPYPLATATPDPVPEIIPSSTASPSPAPEPSPTETAAPDLSAPVVTFVSPAEGTSGRIGLTVSGYCEAGLAVSISGTGITAPTEVACSDGSFSQAIVFSDGDGAKSIVITQTDAAGNAGSSTRIFTKDSTGPELPELSINGGAASVNSTAVTLTLAALGSPSEMYVTNVPECASGGNWVPYSTSMGWTLGQTSGTANVYVRFRDALGNLSSCVMDSIEVVIGSLPGRFAVSAVTVSGGNIVLTWGNSAGATSYAVKYGPSSGSYPSTYSANATSPLTVSGLSATSDWYFRVVASNASGTTDSASEAVKRHIGCTGSYADITLPLSTPSIFAQLSGGGGGGGAQDWFGTAAPGGSGDFYSGGVSYPGTSLRIYAACGGRGGGETNEAGSSGGYGYQSGGDGSDGVCVGSDCGWGGAGGGGSSAIVGQGSTLLVSVKGGAGGKSSDGFNTSNENEFAGGAGGAPGGSNYGAVGVTTGAPGGGIGTNATGWVGYRGTDGYVDIAYLHYPGADCRFSDLSPRYGFFEDEQENISSILWNDGYVGGEFGSRYVRGAYVKTPLIAYFDYYLCKLF